jgi:hypothetical protein
LALILVDHRMADINSGHGDVNSPEPASPTDHASGADTDSSGLPGIVIRPGPTGPRAALVDGPDIWEVIGALRAVRDEDPSRSGSVLHSELRTVTGLTTEQVSAVLGYYAAHPEDVDARIAANDEAAERALRPPTTDETPPW